MIPPPHLNDYLKKFLPLLNDKKTYDPVKAGRAPYLTLVSADARELTTEMLKEIAADDLLSRCPFPEFRFCVDYVNAQGGAVGSIAGYVRRVDGEFCITAFTKDKNGLGPILEIVKVIPKPEIDHVFFAGKIFDAKTLKDETAVLSTPDPDPDAKFAYVVDGQKPGTPIVFDTADIADEKLRAIVENMDLERRQMFIQEAMKMDFHRYMDEDGMYKDTKKVLSRITSHDYMLIAKKLVSKLSNEVKELDRHISKSNHHVDILRGARHLLESSAAAGGTVKDSSRIEDPTQGLFMSLYRCVSVLCYEYLAPQNFAAKVSPPASGRSVEWVQAREHYTTIHRKHEANNKAVKEGSIVKSDLSKHLTRSAHSRRAHTRLLSSSRYTYARGQRVAVRATWCGPQEWKDSAGQTYKILVPVK